MLEQLKHLARSHGLGSTLKAALRRPHSTVRVRLLKLLRFVTAVGT
jgi:hypothetical protein